MPTITIKANVRIVASIRGQQLHPAFELIVDHEVDPATFNQEYPLVFSTILDAFVRRKAVEGFVQRLRNDSALRRRIGGTRWCVDVVGSISMHKDSEEAKDYANYLKDRGITNERRQEEMLWAIADNIDQHRLHMRELLAVQRESVSNAE